MFAKNFVGRESIFKSGVRSVLLGVKITEESQNVLVMEACGDISFARHHVSYFLCVSLVGDSLDKLKDCAFSRRNRTRSLDFSVF